MLALIPLAAVPLSAALRFLVGAPPFWIFATASLGVVALAYHISEATERVAETAGPAVGEDPGARCLERVHSLREQRSDQARVIRMVADGHHLDLSLPP